MSLNPLQIGEGSAPFRKQAQDGADRVSIPFRSGRGALPCRQYLPRGQHFTRANPTKFRVCCQEVVFGSKTHSKNVRNPLIPDHLHKSDEVFGASLHPVSAVLSTPILTLQGRFCKTRVNAARDARRGLQDSGFRFPVRKPRPRSDDSHSLSAPNQAGFVLHRFTSHNPL